MGTPDAVMDESLTYLQIYFMGSLGSVMYNIFVGTLQAMGDSKHPLYYLIASSIVNVVLDILFIAGFSCRSRRSCTGYHYLPVPQCIFVHVPSDEK